MTDATIPPTVIDRKTALALGLTRYFTGKPCPHSHLAERNTLNYKCMACSRDTKKRAQAALTEEGRDRRRQAHKAWHDKRMAHPVYGAKMRAAIRKASGAYLTRGASAVRALRELGITI